MVIFKAQQRITVTRKSNPYLHYTIHMDFSLEKKQLCKKQVFLSNKTNKQSFVDSLANSLENAGHEVFQSPDDADLDIVFRAIDEVSSGDTVLVGDDTDLLVLLNHYFDHSSTDNQLFMY